MTQYVYVTYVNLLTMHTLIIHTYGIILWKLQHDHEFTWSTSLIENTVKPGTNLPGPADGQPGSTPATNKKAEPAVCITETKNTTTNENAAKPTTK